MNEEEAKPRPRRQFTYDEDKTLKEGVSKYGENDWESIAALLPNRTARQCRDRWNKYLSPNIRDTIWTDEEDRLLLRMIDTIGTKWSKISACLPGRSDISIKNRFKQLRMKTVTQAPQFYHYQFPPPVTNYTYMTPAPSPKTPPKIESTQKSDLPAHILESIELNPHLNQFFSMIEIGRAHV